MAQEKMICPYCQQEIPKSDVFPWDKIDITPEYRDVFVDETWSPDSTTLENEYYENRMEGVKKK